MDMRPEHDGYFGTLVYDPLSDTWTTVEWEPRLLTEQVHVARDLDAAKSWDECVRLGRGAFEREKHACVHNGRLVVFTAVGGYTQAYERATDGSWWRTRESECDRYARVSESVLLG